MTREEEGSCRGQRLGWRRERRREAGVAMPRAEVGAAAREEERDRGGSGGGGGGRPG